MTEKAARNFALRDAKGNENGVFAGKSPRQAALKAANRGITDIRLRERGTKKVHIFTGERKQVKKPALRASRKLLCHGYRTNPVILDTKLLDPFSGRMCRSCS